MQTACCGGGAYNPYPNTDCKLYKFLHGSIFYIRQQQLATSTSVEPVLVLLIDSICQLCPSITMAVNYTVRFKNLTPNAYHFAVYQKYPESPGLDSIAWQVRGLGPGATNRADWALKYEVAIADWDADQSK